ncbi:hypothetical protein C2845_PM03G14770 [Panicum miliaceum]|uniref:pectinesterase n=1 Tax=Panicum miliaceum TaxID=4540 RepID=A0A3L6T868_PANMI|nr:hypothetical protein C2845_PM03G14770 [Panicum miliaceum]
MQPFWFSRSSSSSLLVLILLLVLLLRLSTPSLARAPVSRTITVDRHQGRGDFRTVQSAVDSVPDGNRNWIKIHVNAGSYREKVTIPARKRYILLEGAGSSRTDISFNANAHAGIDQIMRRPNVSVDELSPTFRSATFTVLADNFVARDISFKNTYKAKDMSKENQAVAALVGGDRSAFYGCEFHGFQDTLCDFRGRHYFRRCLVRGGVDFVFGYGQSIYEDCVLVSAMPSGPQPGWLTAHARLDAGSPGGLVFKGGAVTGTGRIYLGRAWNGYATVVFYGTRMDHIVVPQGWQAWNAGNDVYVSCIESNRFS